MILGNFRIFKKNILFNHSDKQIKIKQTNIITNLIIDEDDFFQESWGDFLKNFTETISLETKTKSC